MQQLKNLDTEYNKMVANIKKLDDEFMENSVLRESTVREQAEEEERKN